MRKKEKSDRKKKQKKTKDSSIHQKPGDSIQGKRISYDCTKIKGNVYQRTKTDKGTRGTMYNAYCVIETPYEYVKS